MAFTGVELVVVLAVLVVLVGLRLVASSDSKALSARVICLNNLRQLTTAWTCYAHDFGGFLPGNLGNGEVGIVSYSNMTWCLGYMDFTGGNPAGADTDTSLLKMGQIGRYIGDVRIFKCPADFSLSHGTSGLPRVRSVAMNCYVGQRAGPYTVGFMQFQKMNDLLVSSPSRTYVFLDEREDSIHEDAFELDMTGSDPVDPGVLQMVSIPADYHDRGANLSFADGHAETWRWRDPRTTPPRIAGQLPTLGQRMPSNVDIQRLQAVASRRAN